MTRVPGDAAGLRLAVRENFAKIALTLMVTPRYRHQSIADLQQLVLEPLLQDRVAIAYAGGQQDGEENIAGIAFWASVSEEVDAKIKEQVRAGVFPVHLKPDEWNSGSIHWLFDVIASNERATAHVLANFRQVVASGDVRMHPMIGRLLDPEMLASLKAGQTA